MIANPAWRFFNFYLLRGGFREGGRGLYAAMAAAFYVFLKYAKIYERRLQTQRRLEASEARGVAGWPRGVTDNVRDHDRTRNNRRLGTGRRPDARGTRALDVLPQGK